MISTLPEISARIKISAAGRILFIIGCLLIIGPDYLFSQVITNEKAAVSVKEGTFIISGDAVNNEGTLTNDGNLNLSGSYTSTGTTGGDGIYTLGGSWTNTGGIFIPGSSTVIFNGSDDQFITRTGGETFFSLKLENSGASLNKWLTIRDNVTVLGTLTMSLGNIDAGTWLLHLSNPLTTALNYTSQTKSRIRGYFERSISQQAVYLFPLGTADSYNSLNFNLNSFPVQGSVLSRFVTENPGNSGLPVPDPPVEIFDSYPDGYWSLRAKGGFSVTDFNISLNAEGFADTIRDVTRVIRRDAGGDWATDGTHRDAVDNIVNRDNLTGDISPSGTDFAIGRIRPLIISHPRDTTVCENSNPTFSVEASGAEKLKYTWYKEPGTEIRNGAHYQGARTPELTIIGAKLEDAGEYYCIVTDRYKNKVRSNNATLVVMKIPVANVTPSDQPHECSDIDFEDIILGLDYWDPGTTFIWKRDNPEGIETQIPESGSADNIGDALSGSFINRTDYPVTITFIITPVGPSPTYCTGKDVMATITVNPTPRVIPVNADPVICYGESTSITLTTPTKMTRGEIVFDYFVDFEGNPGQIVGNSSPMTLRPGNSISYRYENNSDTVLRIFYTITPKNNQLGCRYDSIAIPEVKVHPKPLQDLFISTPFTCAGSTNGEITAVLARGSKPDVLTWTERPWLGDTTYTTTLNHDRLAVKYAGMYNLTVTDNHLCSNSIEGLAVLGTTFSTNIYVINKGSGGYGTLCPGIPDGEIWINEEWTSTAKLPLEYWLVYNEEDTVRSGIIQQKEMITKESGLPAGYYKLIVRDGNGCYNTDYPMAVITEPPRMEVSFKKSDYNGYNITCRGYNDGFIEAVSVNGGNGGPYTFFWETEGGYIAGPDNESRIGDIPAGIYYLTTTDSRGCQRRDTIIMNQPEGMELVDFDLSTSPDGIYNISCNEGSDGFIKLTISGGAGPYNYFWSGPASFTAVTKDIENLTAGTYVCRITDKNGCELKVMPYSHHPSFTLAEPSELIFNATTSQSADGSYNIGCNGGTGSIKLNVTGGTGAYEYIWSTENGSAPEEGLAEQPSLRAGTYSVKVRDGNLCEKDTVIILTQPGPVSATFVPTHITCHPPGFNNGSISLIPSGGVAPYNNFLWSNGETTENIDGLTEGYYSVTFTDANGCSFTGGVEINLPPPLSYELTVSDYNGFNVTCNGREDGWISISMNNGQAPYVYEWKDSGGGFISDSDHISGLGKGSYVVNITDANMCTATETIEICEPGKFGINILKSSSIAGGFNINCAGENSGSVEIQPVNQAGPVRYLWSDGGNTAMRDNLPAGDYRVFAEDANGCMIDSLVTLTEPDPIKLSFEVTPPWCPDKPDGMISLDVTGGVPGTTYTYLWSDGSVGTEILNIVEGKFVVAVTDINGCTVRDSVLVKPLNSTCLIIPNAFSPNGDLVNDKWNIGLIELYPEAEVKIFNRWGGTVWKSERGYPHPWDGRSNGTPLPVDSYHYIIDLGKGRKPIVGNVTIVR
ncbi:MAG TPA: gliding motility-associated C-terminal domain-containing protein [Bacteroidales bacterium]|jgi:gliding motility-associated-like protein|nr:gliding motility-associated C-terminal domain-containing protein [Bacteroidales bacterium]HQJ81474.1 gliding motility-associated C-terminal domain-containing protein [Bacteroidales bacterium]